MSLPSPMRWRRYRLLRPLIDASLEAWLLFGTMCLGWGLIVLWTLLHVFSQPGARSP